MGAAEQSTAPPNQWTEVAYKRFWHTMGEIFGRPWYEQNGPEPTQVWMGSLSGLSYDKAAAVLQHFRASGDAFPPNLSQVMAKAREIKLRRDEPKALPKPANASVAEKCLSAMKAPKHGHRRNVFRPGESYNDYLTALGESGKTKHEFDRERLALRGWTDADEEQYRAHATVCGFIISR